MMNRSKKIIKDILLFALASFVPKLISFFLVPLYTSCLSTADYGIAELLNTIYSLVLPILTLDISDAIMIYTIECKSEGKENVPIQIGQSIIKVSTLALVGVLFICWFFINVEYTEIYCAYILIQYVLHALYNNYLAYYRGKNKVGIIVTGSIISSVVVIMCNVVFILLLHWGLFGLLMAAILGPMFSVVYFIIKGKNGGWNTIPVEEKKILRKKMLQYSAPLIFTGVAWWINSSSDRVFISVLAGVSLNGVYAVATKIPSILTACHSIIYQALQLSVFNEIHSSDKEQYLKKLYRIYNATMIIVCSTLILLNKPLALLLFKNEFYTAWHYVPALLISTVCFSVSGYIATIAAATKKTTLIAKAAIVGAIVNTLLNILLIPAFKLYGAVSATLIGYFIIWLIIAIEINKETGIQFDVVFSCINYLILLIQWIVMILLEDYSIFLETSLLLVVLILNRNGLNEMIRSINALISAKFKAITSK